MANKKFEFDTDGFKYYHNTYVKNPINSEKSRAQSAENTLNGKVSALETAVGSGGSVDSRIATAKAEIKGNATSACDTLGEAEAKINANTSAISAEATRAQAAEEQLRTLYNNLQQSQPVPVTSLPATGEAGKIYRLAGTNSYSDYMWDGTQFVKMAEYDNAIDDEPTAGSDNLVKSGGVYSQLRTANLKIDDLTFLQTTSISPILSYSGMSLVMTQEKVFESNDSTTVHIFEVGLNTDFVVKGICEAGWVNCGLINSLYSITAYTALSYSVVDGNFIFSANSGNYQYVAITVNNDTAYSCGKSVLTINIVKELYTAARKIVNIYKTDNEVEILNKMLLAYSEGNCDVYWENSTYTFESVYNYMRDELGWTWTMELPIGNGCRYFFNNSTLISNYPENYSDSRNILGSKAEPSSYELYDGILINNGGTYCVHDEAANGDTPYIRKYHNMEMHYNSGEQTQYLSRCIGGGMGKNGNVVIENCIFTTTNNASDLEWHGFMDEHEPIKFKISVCNCYISKSLTVNGYINQDDNITVNYCNNSSLTGLHLDENISDVYNFNNETRQ